MIDENKTFILFGYTSDTLSFGSHKKVWKICDICKEERLIQYRYYINLCLKCSHATDDYRKKHSNTVSEEKNPNWKGGKKLATARRNTKRRELFGFILHNKAQKDFHGHHLDFNHIIFIPKELHTSIYHSVTENKNMDLINNAVCDWYLEYQIIK